jgi:nucleotide-binding universal stress UspA family protein
MFKQILCPTDLEQRSDVALKAAVQVAHRFNAKITLLNVHPEFMGREERELLRVSIEKMKEEDTQAALQAREKMNQSIQKLHVENVPFSYLLRGGKVEAAILEVAGEIDADLIVMASDGRDNIVDFVAGTITEHIINRSSCPVLVVPYKPN